MSELINVFFYCSAFGVIIGIILSIFPGLITTSEKVAKFLKDNQNDNQQIVFFKKMADYHIAILIVEITIFLSTKLVNIINETSNVESNIVTDSILVLFNYLNRYIKMFTPYTVSILLVSGIILYYLIYKEEKK